jgi:hypothetical protein
VKLVGKAQIINKKDVTRILREGIARLRKETMFPHVEAHRKSGFTAESLRRLLAAFCVAEEMGESVGRGQVLLRSLPEGAEMIAMPPVNSPLRKRI